MIWAGGPGGGLSGAPRLFSPALSYGWAALGGRRNAGGGRRQLRLVRGGGVERPNAGAPTAPRPALVDGAGMGVTAPAKQAYMHSVIPSQHRTSVISLDSMMGNAGAILCSVGHVRIADRDGMMK